MRLNPGATLGPYQILGKVGEGGMGVVYRARDERLARDVAIKVIAASVAKDPERLRRFQIEARAAGRLSHPNIVTIHDVGSTDGSPFIVSEMLEGETLRDRLVAGAIPARRAVAAAIQLAHALASAHKAGIIHRDLKPENLFLTANGTLKVLDFGIAKLFQDDGAQEDSTTGDAPALTMTGTVLGTASYMAPEQIRVQQVDHRADLFAFGAILYEMLTGERAFPGATPADRMSAILGADPRPLPKTVEGEAPGIGRVIVRCLEKRPEDRFQSAEDLAFTLELIEEREPGADGAGEAAKGVPAPARFPVFERLTYREGGIRTARFAPDGQSVIYGAELEGRPTELMWYFPGSPESRNMGSSQTDLFSVAPTGELAVSLRVRRIGGFLSTGTLGRMPPGGGAARELLEDVFEADWDPEGKQLAVIREVRGMTRLEYPIGKVIHQTTGWMSHARISPDGKWIALLDHPLRGDDMGAVAVVSMEGRMRTLTDLFATTRGLAWNPEGSTIWFSAVDSGADRKLYVVPLDGPCRLALSLPGATEVMDVSRNGSLLLGLGDERLRMAYRDRSGNTVRDLSWLDWSLIRDISPDGKRILFDETGAGGGRDHAVYVRDVDGSNAVRLGEGTAMGFSPDGKWVLAMTGTGLPTPCLLPVGAGSVQTLSIDGLKFQWGSWFPDGKRLCLMASEPGQGLRLYELDLASGRWRRITDEENGGYQEARPSHNGHWVIALGPEGEFVLYGMEGERRSLPGIPPTARIMGFSADDDAVFYFLRGQVPAPVYRLDLASGERTHWVDIAPPSVAGVVTLTRIVMTPDAKHFAYSYPRFLTKLYSVTGLT
jgi:Tol biopolymer transport system component